MTKPLADDRREPDRSDENHDRCVAVVVPCYRVASKLADVLSRIGPEVSLIYCVDDACPEGSGAIARASAGHDPRVRLVVHGRNQGVGGAVMSGYAQALADGADVIVKLDGDGQMDPLRIPDLIAPILQGKADYAKANRFYHLEDVRAMPWVRLVGNAGLSFLSKLSSGYWNIFDPTNGYTAVHSVVARALPFHKIAKRYFFESDMLFRLNTVRAVVMDVPMQARYADESSSLCPVQALVQFPLYHARNFTKRIFYSYFLRDFNMASLELVAGLLMLFFGTVFGLVHWVRGAYSAVLASSGTVMLAALPVIVGVQCLLSFFQFDTANLPREPLQSKLRGSVEKADFSLHRPEESVEGGSSRRVA